jgi:acetate kinase
VGHVVTTRPRDVVLCVNAGSSTVKCALYRVGDHEERLAEASTEGSGPAALDDALAGLRDIELATAVGHRIVHGGPSYDRPIPIDDRVLADLRGVVPFAPLHLPPSLAAIDSLRARWPELPHVACFDTGFHRTMPESAWRLPLPSSVVDLGVRRYGFHGLSCEFVVAEIGAELLGRAVIAHLGSGASLTAVRDGRSVDTTMGLTPTGGVVMSTRSGDLDPGILIYLAREHAYDAGRLEQLVDCEAGLLGLSGASGDMRVLVERRARSDPAACLAVEVFATRVRMQVAAFAALLGGLDSLVFTGGIGAASATIRGVICAGLGLIGVQVDEALNAASAEVISTSSSAAEVRAMTTDEQLVIARHTHAVLS